jgi:hypothetical protein
MDPRPVASSHRLDPAGVTAALADVQRAIVALAELLRRRSDDREAPTGDVSPELDADDRLREVPANEQEPLKREGEFCLSGLTLGAGQFVVGSVSFARRADTAPPWGDITLHIDDQQNLPEGGLVVMRDGGFAPSREGFALAMASAEAGVVRVHGRWSVASPAIDVPRG